jgi:UDP-N-acetyl-D-mannosaminuronic acid dehydrogenase
VTARWLPEAVRDADAVVVAANHSAFEDPEALATIRRLARPGCVVADPWACLGFGDVFSPASAEVPDTIPLEA